MEEGSIIFRRSKSIGFCKEGVILGGESQPIKADVVILATGYRGDQKLRNIFTSPTFQKYITSSPSSPIPLYR
jgi:dimethylaniline monooxygenase (N-oxide forming)